MKDGVDLRAIVAFEGDGLGNYREPDHDWDRMFQKRFPLEKPVFLAKDHKNSIEGRWVYDTPGIVNSRQLINYLVEEEIEEVVPRGIIPPRFCILREGRSLLISGLVQIDLLEHGGTKLENRQIYLSVIASHSLPLRITWDYRDADNLRRREDMICEHTKVKKRLVPFCLEGDDPWRGCGGGDEKGKESMRGDEELEVVEGQWKKNEGADEVEGGSEKETRQTQSSRRGRRRDSNSSPSSDSSAYSIVDEVIKPKFSSSFDSNFSPRPRPLPPWTSQTFRLAGCSHSRWFETSVAEILLSSVGFVGVSTGSDCLLRVSSFGGSDSVGIRTGDSVLLRDIFQLKGLRGKRTDAPEDGKGRHMAPFFETKKPYF